MAELEVVTVNNPKSLNLIFGQSHFIKTVEDCYEALVTSSTSLKFGIAFCEASGPRLIRWDGNDKDLIELAKENAQRVGCGHTFFIFMDGGFPINVMHALKNVPEIVHIFCATANPLQVVVAKTEQGRGVMGVIGEDCNRITMAYRFLADGGSPLGVENEQHQQERKDFLRKIGYKR